MASCACTPARRVDSGGARRYGRGVSPHEWQEVSAARIESETGPRFVRTRSNVIWRAGDAGGVFATHLQRSGDSEECMRVFGELFGRLRRPIIWLTDVREFRMEASPDAVMEELLAGSRAFVSRLIGHLARAALVVSPGYWHAFWLGTKDLCGDGTSHWSVTCDIAEAWRALGVRGAGEELPMAVAWLMRACQSEPSVRQRVEMTLRQRPALTLSAVAKAVGSSTRSLQRELASGDEHFAELRQRARYDRAVELLVGSDDKIASIAGAVGFRSASHFVAWFRALSGHTPGEFRARGREGMRPDS